MGRGFRAVIKANWRSASLNKLLVLIPSTSVVNFV